MESPRIATLLSVQIPSLSADTERTWDGGASCQYVLEERTRPSSKERRGPVALHSVGEHLQRFANQLLAATDTAPQDVLRAFESIGVTDSPQTDATLPTHGITLPPLKFASIAAAAAVLKDRISRAERKHSLEGRTARKGNQCRRCSKSNGKPLSSACSCDSPISFVSSVAQSRQADGREAQSEQQTIRRPSWEQLLAHPVACLSLIPKGTSKFIAAALAGATAKTITAPLDRLKLILQVQDINRKAGAAATTLPKAIQTILKTEGVLGFWKGNVPQVVRILPYSAVQLFSYEIFKKCFKGKSEELSVAGRLAAGACAGMTSTLMTFPLDTLRFKMAVEPDMLTMSQAARTLFRNEGAAGFYRGLGPGLLGIAPYVAINFCAYDLVKKAFPEKQQKTPQVSFATAVIATTLATVTCYPLDTIRRQMQVTGCEYTSLFQAFPVIIGKYGVAGLYRGFLINALKNLPTSSIRLTTYQSAKDLIAKSNEEWKALVNERQSLQ